MVVKVNDAERNTAPEEKWLEVWRHLNNAKRFRDASNADLIGALEVLLPLLEPPSVRGRRKGGEA